MFILDQHSNNNLKGVHPSLVAVVQDMAKNGQMPFLFGISQGLRTLAQQKADVANGKSQTMASRHLDGHAIDFVVLNNGQPSWAWNQYYVLADQMRAAGLRCSIPLIWGGCWDRETADYTDTAAHESAAYVLRSKAHGGPGFIDGPHLELPIRVYPAGENPALVS